MHWLAGTGIAIVVLLSLICRLAIPLPAGSDPAETMSYRFGEVLGSFILPTLLAWAIAGRRSRRNPNAFAAIFCGLTLLLLVPSAIHLLRYPHGEETPQQKITRLMREANGSQPVPKSFFGEDAIDTRLRELLKSVLMINRDFQTAAGQIDLRATGKIGTTPSLYNTGSAADAIRQLHAAYDLDRNKEARLQQLVEGFRSSFNDQPPQEREAILRGINDGLLKTMPVRQRALAAEKMWLESVDDLYNYAQSVHSSLILNGGKIAIPDPAVRQEFNLRVRSMNSKRQEVLQAMKEFDDTQAKVLKDYGLSRHDVGLK